MTTPPQSNTPYPMKEIKKHKTKKSTWMVIHNDVYDVTSFLQEHPGGEESLLEVAGKDATQAFEDVGHSPDARELMKKYKIGYLPEEERTTHVESCPSNWKKYLLIALAVVIVAAVVAKKMNANK